MIPSELENLTYCVDRRHDSEIVAQYNLFGRWNIKGGRLLCEWMSGRHYSDLGGRISREAAFMGKEAAFQRKGGSISAEGGRFSSELTKKWFRPDATKMWSSVGKLRGIMRRSNPAPPLLMPPPDIGGGKAGRRHDSRALCY